MGDLVQFAAARERPALRNVLGESTHGVGSRGQVLDITPTGDVLVQFDVTGRWSTLQGDDLAHLRLGYAQHIHRAQGATVNRTLVVTGG